MGFESMDKSRLREIASRGGKNGGRHVFTPDEAREAGRRGGERVAVNREHMVAIGRRGGETTTARHGSPAAAQGRVRRG